MSARYAATGQQSPVGTGEKTSLEMLGGTGGRFKLFDLLWGASGTPADNSLVHSVIRITAGGTGSSVTPEPLDPADVVSLVVCDEDTTIEPTPTGIPLLEVPVNLRATYRWIAAPDSEIIVAAVANEGLANRVLAASYTGQSEVSAMWIE